MIPRPLLHAVLLLLLAARVIAAPTVIDDRWYIVELAGAKAGHMHERTERLDDGDLRVSSVMALSIRRGPAQVNVAVEANSVEHADGDPVSMRLEQRLGAALLTTDVSFDGRTATIVESQFGQTTEPRTFNVPPEALMPDALARELERRIKAGEQRITLSGLDPTSAGVVESTYTRGERAVLEAAGRAAPATKWIVEQSVMPGVQTTYYLDDSGEMVRGEVAMGGITFTMTLAERELALADNKPAELLVSTLVTPDKPIANPRTLRSATYLMRTSGDTLADLPSWGAQRATRVDPRTQRVRVSLETPGATATADERAEAITPSAMIDSRDPEVVNLAAHAVEGMSPPDRLDARRVANALRAAAHDFISEKSLDVGFATASEVARTKQGDCTEHAVLLAALIRARGIPSRVVSGLVYVDEFVGKKGIFGFHMWTQALIPDDDGVERWTDFDATLPEERFDAAHIGVAVSTLGGPERVNTMAAVAPLMGTLSIEVERAGDDAPDTMRE